VQVLRQTALAGLAKAEDLLNQKDALHLGANPQLDTVPRVLDLFDLVVID
jgi:hypothetical protein